MACAVLVALTCAVAASAASYVEYSGVKMPAYGGGGDYEMPRDVAAASHDDYHGHSPDAPASLDYKYEEEPRIKTEKPTKDSEETEVWRKPGRKQRGLMRPLDTVSADVSKYEEEDIPKYRSSHRYPKHRSRLKGDPPSGDEESPPRRPIKYNRDRKDDVSDIDRKNYFRVDKDDFPDDKSKEFDDDVKFVNEATTRRVNRRKPRDRHIKRKSDADAYDEDLNPNRPMKSDSDEKDPGLRRTRPAITRTRDRDRFRPVLDDEDEELTQVQPLNKPKPKSYDDYDDYYDMKRVYSIKNKLPSLLRRTSERSPSRTSSEHYLEMLLTHRRMLPRVSHEDVSETSQLQTRASPTSITTTTKSSLTTPTVTEKTTTTITTASTTTIKTPSVNASALSLAEKSRLSIMKKDQRKEGHHIDPPTKKPPVLLQVTRQLPTVVMVEPPSSLQPWMRAQELSEDTPERIDRVKKLMRHKLVSEAKDIRDLTDNWDDLVCDYIDVALIDSGTTRLRSPSHFTIPFLLLLLPCACYV